MSMSTSSRSMTSGCTSKDTGGTRTSSTVGDALLGDEDLEDAMEALSRLVTRFPC
jgi:hypothetical protein